MRQRILGSLVAAMVCGFLPLATLGQINVAVVAGLYTTHNELAGQLNDDTYYDFNAVVVQVSDIDTLSELQAYDAVVLGCSGFGFDPSFTNDSLAALRQFLDNGGGIVTVGWWSYLTDQMSGQMATDADYITPTVAGPYQFIWGPPPIETVPHDITNGIGTYNTAAAITEYELAADPGSTVIGNVQGNPGALVIVYQDILNGRSVYLGGVFLANSGYGNSGMRSGLEDRLLEQAVNWVANPGPPTPRCIYQVSKVKNLADACGKVCDVCPYVRGDLVCLKDECRSSADCKLKLKGFNACANGGGCKVIADLVGCDIPPRNCKRCR